VDAQPTVVASNTATKTAERYLPRFFIIAAPEVMGMLDRTLLVARFVVQFVAQYAGVLQEP
jgi:hypothetical protein